MARIAYSYIRCSRPEQALGRSLKRQKELSEAWCKRNGYVLDTSLKLTDKGKSGFTAENVDAGKLGEFIQLCQKGKIKRGSVLIVENLDRLSRQKTFDGIRLISDIINLGIRIVTVEPNEQIFDEDTLNNNQLSVINMVMTLARGHEESAIKKTRLSDSWTDKRKQMANGKKVRHRCSAWLAYNDDKQEYEFNEKAPIIKRMCKLYLSGFGIWSIARIFNEEEVPTIGIGKQQAKFWGRTSINRILSDRALIGEFQPKYGNKKIIHSKRENAGDPIPDYYPSLIKESDFYAIQKKLGKGQKGRKGNKSGTLTNLFQGMIKDARDGSPMNIVDKGYGKQLVSSAARAKQNGAVYLAFPYPVVEHGILTMMKTITYEDIAPADAPTDLSEKLETVEGLLGKHKHQLNHIQSKIDGSDDLDLIDTLTPKAVTLRKTIKLQTEEVEELKREMQSSLPSSDDCRSIVDLIQKKTKEQETHRRRFREIFQELIEFVDMLVFVAGHWRMCYLCLNFHNGRKRLIVLTTHRTNLVVGGAIDQDIDLTEQTPQQRLQKAFEELKVRSVKQTEKNIDTYIMERVLLNKKGTGEITDKLWIHTGA